MMKYIFTLVCLLIPSLAFSAQNDWEGVKTLKCTFNNGAYLDDKNIKITDKPFGDNPTLIIDSINIKNKTARAIGNAGADNVVILDSGEILTLIDKTMSGNLIFTGISKKDDGKFYIVTSRHTLIGKEPVFSQSYGTCELFN